MISARTIVKIFPLPIYNIRIFGIADIPVLSTLNIRLKFNNIETILLVKSNYIFCYLVLIKSRNRPSCLSKIVLVLFLLYIYILIADFKT